MDWSTLKDRSCIERLSKYKSALYVFQRMGFMRAYSSNIADASGESATRVRKDFSAFGITGNKKGGYSVEGLISQINRVLLKNEPHEVIVVGVGKIGAALLGYEGFRTEGLNIVAGFDINPARYDGSGNIPVLPLREVGEFVSQRGVKLAIIAVPSVAAQQAFQALVDAGIEGVLNFAPVRLSGPDHVLVDNVSLAAQLENIAFFISARHRQGPRKPKERLRHETEVG
jgi:redox-sensing transcriptional repressor